MINLSGAFRNKKRENPFVQIDKNMISDEKISWKAKGILAYLLSKPDGWVTYATDIEKRSTDGRDAVHSGIKELIAAGYMERKQVRDKGQFKGYEYSVYEYPIVVDSTENGFPVIGKPENGETGNGKSENGKPATSNNNLSNNNLSNNDLSNNDLNNNNVDNAQVENEQIETPFQFYEKNGFGILTPHVGEKIGSWIDDTNEELVIHALKMSVEIGVPRWKYAEAILRDWHNKKFSSVEQVNAAEKKREQENLASNKRGNYRPAREENAPEWFGKDKQSEKEMPVQKVSQAEIDAERAALLKELQSDS